MIITRRGSWWFNTGHMTLLMRKLRWATCLVTKDDYKCIQNFGGDLRRWVVTVAGG